jgi:protein O-mannosyl-transferase
VLEKLPLFAFALASCVVTMVAQRSGEAIAPIADLSLRERVANALVSYLVYIRKAIWPSDLAIFYPHPANTLPLWQAAGVALLLVMVSVLALTQARRRPYFIVGFLWYVGTLVPVIGLIQVGAQGMADRYIYVPNIGLYLIFVWSGADLARAVHLPTGWAGALVATGLVLCALCTWNQVGYWHDSLTLWKHAVDVTTDNARAHVKLGILFGQQKKPVESMGHLFQAVKLDPRDADIHFNLGLSLAQQGREVEAASAYQKAVSLKPDYWQAHLALGKWLFRRGQVKQAREHLIRLTQLKPEDAQAHTFLGICFARERRLDEAIRSYAEANRLNPSDPVTLNNLGIALARQGKPAEAIRAYAGALRLDPSYAQAANNMGVSCSRARHLTDALGYHRLANRLEPGNATYHCNLAAVLQELGKGAESRAEYQKAVRLDPGWPEKARQTAWALATNKNPSARDPVEAVRLARQACQAVEKDRPEFLDTLGASYAALEDFPEAVRTTEKALGLANSTKQLELIPALQNRLALYAKRQGAGDSIK